MSARSVASLGIFTALVAALGFALAGVPNIEMMTLAAFVSGALLGPVRGASVGAGGMAVYSAFNPYGIAPPPVFLAQTVGLGIVGAAGGGIGSRHPPEARRRWPTALLFAGGVGAGLTLLYDLLTNLGTAVAIGAVRDPWPVVAGGVAFGVWHIAWNAALFAVCAPPLLAALQRRRTDGS
jgi:hypothetical protein